LNSENIDEIDLVIEGERNPEIEEDIEEEEA
jgi:hypothetical protein